MKRNPFIVGLILLTFFVIFFLTNIIGPLGLFLTLAYILSIGFWSYPLINNETLGSKKRKVQV